jgi:hypothetical protein
VEFCKRKSCVRSTTLLFIVGVGCLGLVMGFLLPLFHARVYGTLCDCPAIPFYA